MNIPFAHGAPLTRARSIKSVLIDCGIGLITRRFQKVDYSGKYKAGLLTDTPIKPFNQ